MFTQVLDSTGSQGSQIIVKYNLIWTIEDLGFDNATLAYESVLNTLNASMADGSFLGRLKASSVSSFDLIKQAILQSSYFTSTISHTPVPSLAPSPSPSVSFSPTYVNDVEETVDVVQVCF